MQDKKLALVQTVIMNQPLLSESGAHRIVEDYIKESCVVDLLTYAENHRIVELSIKNALVEILETPSLYQIAI